LQSLIGAITSRSTHARQQKTRNARSNFTKEQDGLKQDWGSYRVFCNPPYGRTMGAWARKCFESAQAGALVVLLVPARTDTRWYHDWIEDKAEVTFLRGRLRFGGATTSAPFPSMLSVYSPERPAKICARCGNGFVGRSDAQTCSNVCRQALYRNRNRYGLSVTAEGPLGDSLVDIDPAVAAMTALEFHPLADPAGRGLGVR
jgi:hypothetical protein